MKTPPRPTPRAASVLPALLLATVVLGACSSPTDEGTAPLVGVQLQAREAGGVWLLTQVSEMDAYPDALFEGRVSADAAGCLRLEGSQGTVLWPTGWTARAEGGGTLLVDAGGEAVGAVGDRFRMAGGHLPFLHEGVGFTPEDQDVAASRCPGDFWLATPGTVERR